MGSIIHSLYTWNKVSKDIDKMGKPRVFHSHVLVWNTNTTRGVLTRHTQMIILIRHAQSEGNKNRDIHQYVPDHRVKLTPDGHAQALDAGRRLRALLKPDDTIQFFTSPYRRTRETTEGILRTLTSNDAELGPSPFPRDKIKVYEEPRLREQDFGNFQPCSAEMERMWQERADYGHFFYRIPSGESAADAYDRVSGFNESLWRQFGDADFPSVCILVTHGLMTRVFLMKWYHWSVEYFEDLRNINHCEFIIMKQHAENGKFILQNELRTWSDMKRKAALANPAAAAVAKAETERRPLRMWGGCAAGCNHAHLEYPRRPKRQNTQDQLGSTSSKNGASSEKATHTHAHAHEHEDPSNPENHETHTTTLDGSDADADVDADDSSPLPSPPQKPTLTTTLPTPTSTSTPTQPLPHRQRSQNQKARPASLLTRLGRDGGGSQSGLGSPNDISDEADDSDWFDTNVHQLRKRLSVSSGSASTSNTPAQGSQVGGPARSEVTRSALSQINEGLSAPPSSGSGGGTGTSGGTDKRANSPLRSRRSGSLGRSGSSGSLGRSSQAPQHRSGSAKRRSDSASARKVRSGNVLSEREMIEESGMNEGRRADALGDVDDEEGEADSGGTVEEVVERAKMRDRKSFSEVY